MTSRRANTLLIYLLSLSGGAGRNAVIYANVLAKAGYFVTVACGTTKGYRLDQDLEPRVTVVELGVRRNLRALPRLVRAIRRVGPDQALVIGPGNMAPFAIAAFSAGFRGEVILRVADSPTGMQSLRGPIMRLLKRWTFRRALPRARRVVALTHDMATELEQVWSVPRERVYYIPNGVTLPASLPVRTPAKPPLIICVARLTPQKDHVTLLRAFALLRKQRLCRLWLAGDGREKKRLVNLTRRLGLSDDVCFLGHMRDVAPLYLNARLTVLSSRHEGFGLVLIEALAHACPVVSTDCPTGPAEVINSAEVGELARVGDPIDLAARMADALDKQYDPARLRARAADFSKERLNTRILALFRDRERLT